MSFGEDALNFGVIDLESLLVIEGDVVFGFDVVAKPKELGFVAVHHVDFFFGKIDFSILKEFERGNMVGIGMGEKDGDDEVGIDAKFCQLGSNDLDVVTGINSNVLIAVFY